MNPYLQPRHLILAAFFLAGVTAMIFLPVMIRGGAGWVGSTLHFAGYLAAVAGAVLYGRFLMAKAAAREKRFAEFAAQQDWNHSPGSRRDVERSFPGFELFTRGTGRYGKNLLTGSVSGHALTVFDYHYRITSGTGKNTRSRHYDFTVVVLKPRFPLKPLAIRKENLADRVADAFGWNDLDFESAEFSARYHVSAPDRRWAYDALPARTLALLLDSNAGDIHLSATHIMLPLPLVRDPADVLPVCKLAAGLLDGIPDYARRSRR